MMKQRNPPILKNDGTVNDKATGSTHHEGRSGMNQQLPHPNENTTNRPASLPNDERFPDGTDDGNEKTESTGVTQPHSEPTEPKGKN